jgi:hypothetical protein
MMAIIRTAVFRYGEESIVDISGLVSDISGLLSVCVCARVCATSTFKRRFNVSTIS